MSRFFLSCVLFSLAIFALNGCSGQGGWTTDSNNFGSNSNSAVTTSSNVNIGNNTNRTNSGIPR